MRFIIIIICFVTGCSTKNYGRQSFLTALEKKELTCREIDIEISKVTGFINHVEKESEFSGRSVLSFLGDFGIGNVMEKDSALESAHNRLTELQKLKAQKGCTSHSEFSQEKKRSLEAK